MLKMGKKTRLKMRMSTTTEIITYLHDKDLNGDEDWVEDQDQGSGSWMKDEGSRIKDESHLSPLPAFAYLLTICFFGGCFEGLPGHSDDINICSCEGD